jgi:hypothetical protein
MTIHEPMTLITDYLLGGVSAWLWYSLHRNSQAQSSRFCWRMAFLALAFGAFLGGTWHGVVQNDLLWKVTVLCVGLASFFMVAGSAAATLTGVTLKAVLGLALAKLLAYSVWMLLRDDFIFVVIDTGIAFAVVAGLHLWRFNGWMLAGVALSVVAGLVQASGFALHRHFNHNDLYHVIQIGAMFLLYRGARRLSDAGAPRPAPPAA